MTPSRQLVIASLVSLVCSAASARDLELGTPFRDHMVLQRGKPIPVWGWAEPGDEVTVAFAEQRRVAMAAMDGAWTVRLEPLSASKTPASLTVTSRGGGTITVTDVLVGEVWLGSGQSNMRMQVARADDYEREKSDADLPLVRMFTEESPGASTPQDRGLGTWSVCTPGSVGAFSATLFFFGREIHRALDVPVGLIHSSVGGTPIEAWIGADAQRRSPELAAAVAAIDAEGEALSSPTAVANHGKAMERWRENAAAARRAGRAPPRRPKDPIDSLNRRRIGCLFNGKIAPLVPFAIRGVVWYQGEANAQNGRAEHYRHQLPLLVSDWRERWGEELPFAWVQLPNFGRGGEGWMVVREAMLEGLRLPRTGMAITVDIGDPKDIHPRNKQDVGRRLAAWALADVYEQDVPARSGPLPAGSEVRGSDVVCRFSEDRGLCDRDDGEIDGFELADAAGVWWPARARIDGTTVVVTADGVSAPTAVRYGWAAHPECDLVNAAGMPASPFRVTLRAPADGGASVGRRTTASGRRPDRPNVLVIYSDDHGWADLGVQGIDPNVRTPHLDRLARDGVRFTRGYVSAPQCVPSRAGLLTGRYQQRFGVEDNNHGPLPLGERTIAELLAPAGYTSGWVGKCHLDIGGSKRTGEGYRLLNEHMPQHQGFSDYFRGEINHFFASHDPSGRPFPDAPRRVTDGRCRIEVQTEAALSFLDRRAGSPGDPWFLYLAWYAPHVPLESPEPWFSQTPESLPTKRRQALAMIAAMDDGLGRIRERLRTMGVAEDTLIFFVGDNGAPLGSAWNGSSNGPLAGQKGMVAEGGVRTPFVAAWPGTWPAGTTCDHPVINLDVAATAVAAAGLAPDVTLDGVDLSPFVTGRDANAPHERLFWRWESQAAVLEMPYKLIMLGGHPPMLFDVTDPAGEHHDRDLSDRHPEIVSRLRAKLELWAADLEPPGLPTSSSGTRHHERLFIEHHLATFDGPPPNQVVLEDTATTSVSARRPNIVLFLVDDMGWMDSSPYGSQYHRTPNIARLARQGMRFTRAYAQPLCSPTRASLLTGKNAARHGITSAVGHLPPAEGSLPESAPPNQAMIYPESRTFLDPVEFTLAEALRDAGYHTGHFGKWHLGLSSPHWPEAHGFDVAFHCHPDPGPPGGYFSPYGVVAPGSEMVKGRRAVVGTITDGPPGEYITDRLTDEAIRFIEGHVRESRTSGDRPFFLNLWHFGVHGPWGHKESLTGILTDRKDPSGRQDNPVMASMIESIDESLGRLLDTLDRLEIADETIVVFTSDNGGNTHSNSVGDAKTNKRNDQSPAASSYRKWAGHRPPTNNAPLRDGKGRLYEGGVRVPLIVRFTGLIEPGTTSDALVGCTDVYPTLLELAGLSADPAQVKDGISYAGVLRGTAARGRDSYVIWFPGRPHGAVAYADDWKLIRREEPSPQGDGVMRELYNLADDLGEEKNLADQYPGKVRELEDVIERLLADAGTLTPRPNPDFRGHHSTTERNANR